MFSSQVTDGRSNNLQMLKNAGHINSTGKIVTQADLVTHTKSSNGVGNPGAFSPLASQQPMRPYPQNSSDKFRSSMQPQSNTKRVAGHEGSSSFSYNPQRLSLNTSAGMPPGGSGLDENSQLAVAHHKGLPGPRKPIE